MNEKIQELLKISKTLKILYVEDNEDARNSTLNLLTRFFNEVVAAIDGQDGLEKFSEHSDFDLILSDINMPKMNGINMIAKIRELDKDIPILILSAYNESNYFVETIRIGIEGYLLKPIELNQFLEILIKAIEKISLKKENEEYKKELESKVTMRTKELEYRLYHDSLTELKNRNALLEDLNDTPFSAILLIDIDDFKSYNKLYGMGIGNKILTNFTKFLESFCQDKSYELYRVYADGFIFREINNCFDIDKYEYDISLLFKELSSFTVYAPELNEDIEIDITVGVSFEKQYALEKVDIALKYAKNNRKNFIAYNKSIDEAKQSKEILFWRHEIKDAINDNRIVPVFQPIVDRNQKTTKYEVLMRLKREINGKIELVSPFIFLNTAIKTKQYEKLTYIMVEKSFEIMQKLDADFSINLSFEDIKKHSTALMLEKQIRKYKVGSKLIFEIVESENVDDYELVYNFIKKFQKLDVRIAIDDFGSGFSNYTHIFKIAPNYLKIDSLLIKDIDKDKKSFELVKSIVQLTKALDIKTIAEFVHSKEVFDVCHKIGIDQFQGFYFSPPIQKEELLTHFLETESII